MRILCLTDFYIRPGYRWFWDFVPGNQDEITFISMHTADRYQKWGKIFTSYPAYLRLAWRAMQELNLRKYDLVVAWESDTGLPIAFLRKLLRHKTPPLFILTFSVRGPLAHFRPLLRYAVQGADFLTVPTQYEKEYYANWLNYPVEKIIYCPYGTYDIHPKQASVVKKQFVFSGGRSERDYLTLFKAISDLNIPFIVNARPFNLRGLSIPPNVTINDILPFEAFRELNINARFVVVPLDNVKQAAGITSVLYAMSAGKAVIASDNPGLHDYIRDGETGIFTPPGDHVKLRQAIRTLWENPSLADQMGINARRVYLENFTHEAFAKRVVRTTQEIPGNFYRDGIIRSASS